MKGLLTILFLIFFSGLMAQGQYRGAYPNSFYGVYLGPNICGFSGEYKANVEGENKARIRTQYGFFAKIMINQDISAFTGLHLILQGTLTENNNAQSAGVTVSYVAKTNLTSLAIPALITWTPRRDYGLMIGPQMDLLISATEPWNRSNSIKPDDYVEDVMEKYNSFGLSISAGGYYLFSNGASTHLRFTHGLTQLTKDEWGDVRSWSLELYLGINLIRN